MQVTESEDIGQLFSVGEVAARLGVAPATVRSWGRRYGLVPASRTTGGHRRYSAEELATFRTMQRLVDTGVTPAQAARRALSDSPDQEPQGVHRKELRRGGPGRVTPGGPGGRILAVPGGGAAARGLARAAGRLDAEALVGQLSDLLVQHGAHRTWEEVLVPVLVAAGTNWSRTGTGVEIEHVLSEAAIEAVRTYCAFLPAPAPGRPVLLACAPEDQHTVPLHIVRAALTEQRVPTRMLGGRVPAESLSAAARRTGARRVFIWRQIVGPEGDDSLRDQQGAGGRPTWTRGAVLGGPGWAGNHLGDSIPLVHDLAAAVEALTA